VLYYFYEMNHAALAPWRAVADAGLNFWTSPANPLSSTQLGRSFAASLEMFERTTRRYGKPPFDITDTIVNDEPVAVEEVISLRKDFCHLLNFRKMREGQQVPEHKMLIVAPMSGHYSTLLRGTVESMLPHYDVYITDWIDAHGSVPLMARSISMIMSITSSSSSATWARAPASWRCASLRFLYWLPYP
jgi:poly(3-hydroxybutyrate) depolymerase